MTLIRCADEKCSQLFEPQMPRQIYCHKRCAERVRSREYARRHIAEKVAYNREWRAKQRRQRSA